MTLYQQTRYLVEWTPWADALAEAMADAVRRGLPIAGEVNLENCDRCDAFHSFSAAVIFARKVLPDDAWRCPRIRRQVMVPNDHDDLGNRVKARPSYETEATWEVLEDQPDPDEKSPDWIEDAA